MSTSTLPPAATPSPLAGAVQQPTFSESVQGYVSKLRSGDMGTLPAILAFLILSAVFVVLKPGTFTSFLNIANLFQQGAVVATIGMGLVFVLLLGEIDLSAGFASGVCGAVLAVALTNKQWPLIVALPLSLLTGVVIGLGLGLLVAKVGIPSFIATLAAFLAFQGVVLLIIGNGGNISITNPAVLAIENQNIAPWLGWLIVIAALVIYVGMGLRQWSTRRNNGLLVAPLASLIIRLGLVVVIVLALTFILNQERSLNPLRTSISGIPIVIPVIAVLALGLTFLLNGTAFGRHVYGVGGNAEATRRAGINVARVRITCFIICSTMAACAGIFGASRATSVDPNAGGSNVLLYAVGAAVIGGTSLFGGKGRVVDALIGAAVIAVIDNGMGLLGYSAGVKYVVTGGVLVLAAGVDALSRGRMRGAR